MLLERALWFVEPRRVELRPCPAPALGEGQVKARALCSGISQGTELLLYRGEGPTRFDPSLDGPDDPLYPRRYGYSWVGQIVESRALDLHLGQRVFALRPHGEVHVLRARELRALPDGIPSPRATLAANLETAITVVWDAGVAFGDRVVVLGGGVVGLLVAWLCRRSGAARVRLVEPSPRRRAAGLALGVHDARPPEDDTPDGSADVVVEATGHPANLDRAILHAGPEAILVVASFYGERRSPIALGDEFHRRRLQLKASQVSSLPPQKRPRWTPERRFASVLDCLADPGLDAIVDAPVPFDEAPALYARLDAAPGASLHSVLAYG